MSMSIRQAAQNLIDDVKRRHPGEPLHCPLMQALDESLSAEFIAPPACDPVWQPMDTAPRDGTLIRLAFGSYSPPSVGWYVQGGDGRPWRFLDQQTVPGSHFLNTAVEHLPTHWAPIGDAPVARP